MTELLTLKQAAALVPTHPSYVTLWNWCRHGLKIHGQPQRLTLPHLRIGGKLFVREADLLQFFEALAAADVAGFASPNPTRTEPHRRTRVEREAAIAAAEAEVGGN